MKSTETSAKALLGKDYTARYDPNRPLLADAPQDLDLLNPAAADAWESYQSTKLQQYPKIDETLSMYFGLPENLQDQMRKIRPEIDQYFLWRDYFLATHPELIEYLTGEESRLAGAGMALAFGFGAIAFFTGDWLVDRRGGADRKDIAGDQTGGSGSAIFVGTLLA